MRFIPAHTVNYTKGRTRKIDYIVVHYTGNDGDTAKGNANYYSNPLGTASAHYFIDETEIVQSVKDSDTAWHSGKWQMNSRSIGVEMCSRKDKKGTFYIPKATIERTQRFVCELMEKYDIPLENVIRHYDVTKKLCPEPFVRDPKQWTSFLEGVKEEYMKVNIADLTDEECYQIIEKANRHASSLPPSEYAKTSCQKSVKSGLFTDGNNDGSMDKPQAFLRRQEFATVLDRMGAFDN